uniref:RIN4 pathogenic type III effector avirulence factor Avr cleavage site domain-containing protein n=1 Tax=Noccaea caerulescens TaxID=107243 RepID=A0A1J3CFQ1_NOCCA
MDYEYGGGEYCRRGHVPAFGSWDWNDAVPFTQCFETATTQQPSFLHYAPYPQDRDLYLAGDLYDNHHLVAPAVILLPRRRAKVGQEPKRASSKEQQKYKTEARESNAPSSCPTPVVKRRKTAPKPVDEDLYKVSPQLLSVKSQKKRGGGFGCISRCFLPTRVL